MKYKIMAAALVLAATGTGASSCSSGTPAPYVPPPCGDGKGHWLEDDNSFWEDTHVTVKICVDDGGNVIDIQVD